MLRDADLPLRLLEGRAYLDFLGPQDEPWLGALIAELTRFEGRRARELTERLAEPLPCEAPYFKRRAASRVLWNLWRRERQAAVAPREVRGRLFVAAAAQAPAPGSTSARAWLLETVAGALGTTPAVLEQCLLGDIPGERLVRAPKPAPTPAEAALATNLAVAQAILMRASAVRVRLEGGARPIVRLAKLRGLLVNVVQVAASGTSSGASSDACSPAELEISGPFSLFRHTLLYGRALAELLPHLAWCARFQLEATSSLRGRLVAVGLGSGDPIRPATQPRAFDSRVEQRFAEDFARLAPDWEVIREPEPLRAGGGLLFPDFLLRHRIVRERQLLLEIIGFWTPDYLARKLARLREPGLPRILLCIDADRGCAPEELPPGMPVLRYRRRVDAAEVLRYATTCHTTSTGAV